MIEEIGKKIISSTLCKFCQTPLQEKEFYSKSVVCQSCKKYGVSFFTSGIIESELVINKNYYLVYLNVYQDASVVELQNESKSKKVLTSFPMEKLTPELVAYWFNKLKTYVLFQ